MSNVALTWAWSQAGLDQGSKLVLVALADKADEQHSCYPGQRLLAAMTCQGERTVRRHLERLESQGYIRRRHRYREDGTRSSDRYVLPIGEVTVTTTGQSGRLVEPSTTGQLDPDYRPNSTGLPANLAGHEPKEEPTEEPTVRRARAKQATGAPDEWPITDQMRFWARSKGIAANLDDETEVWLDHHRARGSTFKDWGSAWRTWMARTKRYGASTTPQQDTRPQSRSPWAQ